MDREQAQAEDAELTEDRERNPDIGQSKGSYATGENPESIAGENTVVGDVENDSSYGGGVDPDQLGRTNK